MGEQQHKIFEARWSKLELDRLRDRSVDSTIGAETLAAGAAAEPVPKGGTLLIEPAPGAAHDATLPLTETHADPSSLPHLSIGAPVDQTLRVGSRGSKTADLQVRDLLGQGGMGQVHLARQVSLGRDVAIKSPKAGAPAWAASALLSEGRITGSLEHPGIIPVHALGVDDGGQPVLVMKRVEGVEWRELLRSPEHPQWTRWASNPSQQLVAHLEMLAQVCNAAHFAHDRGVIHRDIKPENVMLGSFGEVYLVDWGIAIRVDRQPPAGEGPLVGSPAYMAPEMVLGNPVDARTDVYLLGATLFEVLSGTMPHDGDDMETVLLDALRSDPPELPPSTPDEVSEICRRAMSASPGDRYESALELRHAISRYLQHRGSIALTDSALERLEQLRAQLGEGDEPPADLAEAHRTATEARFGFVQALSEWEANDKARQGLDDCLGAMIDLELRQENAKSARALLTELSKPRASLEKRLLELDKRLEAKRARGEELEQIAHDLDESVSARPRVLASWGVAALGVLISAAALYSESQGGVRVRELAGFTTFLFVVTLLAAAFLRRSLLVNAFNRRVIGVLLVSFATLSVHRIIEAAAGSPVERVITIDSLILTALIGAAAVTLARWLWWLAAMFAGCTIYSALVPERALIVFALATGVAIIVPALRWWWVYTRHGEPPPE